MFSIVVFLLVLWFLTPHIATFVMTRSVVTFHPDGSRWQEYHIKRWGKDAGKVHGTWKAYHPRHNGVSVTGRRRNGAWDGVVTFLDIDGCVQFQRKYEQGDLVETVTEPPWLGRFWDW